MLINSFFLPLVLTIFLEGITAFLMGYRDKQLMLLIVVVNAITNPLMNLMAVLILYLGMQEFFYWFILPMELLLIPVEWMILAYAIPQKKKELLKLSVVMNIFSFVIGLLVF